MSLALSFDEMTTNVEISPSPRGGGIGEGLDVRVVDLGDGTDVYTLLLRDVDFVCGVDDTDRHAHQSAHKVASSWSDLEPELASALKTMCDSTQLCVHDFNTHDPEKAYAIALRATARSPNTRRAFSKLLYRKKKIVKALDDLMCDAVSPVYVVHDEQGKEGKDMTDCVETSAPSIVDELLFHGACSTPNVTEVAMRTACDFGDVSAILRLLDHWCELFRRRQNRSLTDLNKKHVLAASIGRYTLEKGLRSMTIQLIDRGGMHFDATMLCDFLALSRNKKEDDRQLDALLATLARRRREGQGGESGDLLSNAPEKSIVERFLPGLTKESVECFERHGFSHSFRSSKFVSAILVGYERIWRSHMNFGGKSESEDEIYASVVRSHRTHDFDDVVCRILKTLPRDELDDVLTRAVTNPILLTRIGFRKTVTTLLECGARAIGASRKPGFSIGKIMASSDARQKDAIARIERLGREGSAPLVSLLVTCVPDDVKPLILRMTLSKHRDAPAPLLREIAEAFDDLSTCACSCTPREKQLCSKLLHEAASTASASVQGRKDENRKDAEEYTGNDDYQTPLLKNRYCDDARNAGTPALSLSSPASCVCQ